MPRLEAPTSGRPFYFDRTPLTVRVIFFAEGVAPHATTIRATYTVPANRKAFAEAVQLSIARATAPGTDGRAVINLRSDSGTFLAANLWEEDNAAKDRVDLTFGATMTRLAGDEVAIDTSDVAITGTVNYNGVATITEYDA